MDTVLISGREIPARARRRLCDTRWNNRECWELTMELDCAEAEKLFVHDADWQLRREIKGAETNVVDMSEFSVAGPVIDNRDGTVTVKMGVLTEREALEIILGGKTV